MRGGQMLSKFSKGSLLLYALWQGKEDYKEFSITDIDKGIHITAWIEEALSATCMKHVEHHSAGIITFYTLNDVTECSIDFVKPPNSQDMIRIDITIRLDLLREHETLQQQMFDLIL